MKRYRGTGMPYKRIGGRVFYARYRLEFEQLKRRALAREEGLSMKEARTVRAPTVVLLAPGCAEPFAEMSREEALQLCARLSAPPSPRAAASRISSRWAAKR